MWKPTSVGESLLVANPITIKTAGYTTMPKLNGSLIVLVRSPFQMVKTTSLLSILITMPRKKMVKTWLKITPKLRRM